MLLENCDINEASTVFSRLNSKGTDISKVSMLQAVFYNEKDEILISDRINEIISSLGVYSFDTLKPDDILNCCYRYIGRNFYDSQLLKDIEKLNFTEHLHEIEQDIKHTVEFLHDECYVLSSQLIPYVKQLIAIAGFFKEHQHHHRHRHHPHRYPDRLPHLYHPQTKHDHHHLHQPYQHVSHSLCLSLPANRFHRSLSASVTSLAATASTAATIQQDRRQDRKSVV